MASLGYEMEKKVRGKGRTLGKSVTSLGTFFVDGN